MYGPPNDGEVGVHWLCSTRFALPGCFELVTIVASVNHACQVAILKAETAGGRALSTAAPPPRRVRRRTPGAGPCDVVVTPHFALPG
jgi:hypothetical protein